MVKSTTQLALIKNCRVGVYDVKTNTTIVSSNVIELGSDPNPNTGRLFHYDDSLWTVNQKGQFLAINKQTLALDENKTLTLSNLPSGVTVQDASYNEFNGTLVVLGTNKNLYYFNEALELVNTVTN